MESNWVMIYPCHKKPASQKARVINRGMVIFNRAGGEICITVMEATPDWVRPPLPQVPHEKGYKPVGGEWVF